MTRPRQGLTSLVLALLTSAVASASVTDALLEHATAAGLDKRVVAKLQERLATDPTLQDSPQPVTDTLAELFPAFADAMQTLDRGAPQAAADAFAALADHPDPFVAATSRYLHARALSTAGEFEAAAAVLENYLNRSDGWLARTPYAAHARLLLAATQQRNLRTADAEQALADLNPDNAPEPIAVARRALERALQNRSDDELHQVRELMAYASDRLLVRDAGRRVQDRQAEALALLDRLIEEEQQNEQQGQGQSQAQNQQGQQRQAQGQQPGAPQQPSAPADESTERTGTGQVGTLDENPEADPAEAWGKLPDKERAEILQALREKYPSRYRQLVEQYYRALAEDR